jgi:hypothetical protein
MDTNLDQHHAFEEGLKRFGGYVYSVKADQWDREIFKVLLDSFLPALTTHLREEIETLLDLDKYGGEKLKKAFGDMEKKILSGKLDAVRFTVPLCSGEMLGMVLMRHSTVFSRLHWVVSMLRMTRISKHRSRSSSLI